jgi:galactokinase
MTGAGFGGCAVALVAAEALDPFLATTVEAYLRATGREARAYPSLAAAGAGPVPLPTATAAGGSARPT